jgi:hypothetical protein
MRREWRAYIVLILLAACSDERPRDPFLGQDLLVTGGTSGGVALDEEMGTGVATWQVRAKQAGTLRLGFRVGGDGIHVQGEEVFEQSLPIGAGESVTVRLCIRRRRVGFIHAGERVETGPPYEIAGERTVRENRFQPDRGTADAWRWIAAIRLPPSCASRGGHVREFRGSGPVDERLQVERRLVDVDVALDRSLVAWEESPNDEPRSMFLLTEVRPVAELEIPGDAVSDDAFGLSFAPGAGSLAVGAHEDFVLLRLGWRVAGRADEETQDTWVFVLRFDPA